MGFRDASPWFWSNLGTCRWEDLVGQGVGSPWWATQRPQGARLESLTPPALHPSFRPHILCPRSRIQVEFRRSPQRRPRFSLRRRPFVFLFRHRRSRRRRPSSCLRCLQGDRPLHRPLRLWLRPPPLWRRLRLRPLPLRLPSLRPRHLRHRLLREPLRPVWPSPLRMPVLPLPPRPLRLPSPLLSVLRRRLRRAQPVWILPWLPWRWSLPLRPL